MHPPTHVHPRKRMCAAMSQLQIDWTNLSGGKLHLCRVRLALVAVRLCQTPPLLDHVARPDASRFLNASDRHRWHGFGLTLICSEFFPGLLYSHQLQLIALSLHILNPRVYDFQPRTAIMDPATIIGTTSAILSFVQFSGKIISTAVHIHRSTTGATDDNRNFAAVVANFQERLENLRKDAATCESKAANTGPGQALNDAEKQLLATIKKCEDLATKIDAILKTTTAAGRQSDSSVTKSSTRRTSLRQWLRPFKGQDSSPHASEHTGPTLSGTIKASVQTVWQREVVIELHKDWETCSIQLDQAIFRRVAPNVACLVGLKHRWKLTVMRVSCLDLRLATILRYSTEYLSTIRPT